MSEYGSVNSTKCNKFVCLLPAGKMKRMKSNDYDKSSEFMADLKCGEQVYAVKGFSDNKNPQSLPFIEGDIITIIDQYPDGLCKGFLSKKGSNSKIGYFPTTNVVPIKNMGDLKNKLTTLSPKCSKMLGKKHFLSQNHKQMQGPSTAPVTPAKYITTPTSPLLGIQSSNTSKSNLSNEAKSLPKSSNNFKSNSRINQTYACECDHDTGSPIPQTIDQINPFINERPACEGSSYNRDYPIVDSNVEPDSLDLSGGNCGNRSSSISVDSGWGSANTTIMCNIQAIPEHMSLPPIINTSASHSLESGLASIRGPQSSSSNSSLCSASTTNTKSSQNWLLNNDQMNNSNNNVADDEQYISNEESIIKNWLEALNLQCYTHHFISAGYDFNTLLKMTPEDLNAIGITNPNHRKTLKTDINKHLVARLTSKTHSEISAKSLSLESVSEWLYNLNLSIYQPIILQQGYDTLERLSELTWEDMEEIGIKKLGHQKKLIIALENLRKSLQFHYSFNQRPQINTSHSNDNLYPKQPLFRSHELSSKLSSNKLIGSSNTVMKPVPPIRQTAYLLSHSPHLDTAHPHAPPTPKRTSSIPNSTTMSPKLPLSCDRHAYVNIEDESVVVLQQQIQLQSKPTDEQISPKTARSRSSSIMSVDVNPIPFANENCGTIKQRSSSLGRNEMLREEIESGVANLTLFPIAKQILPLSLPYKTDNDKYKVANSLEKLKAKISYEKNLQLIPSDLQIAIRERVPLPKLHIDDSSSNEDFNDICDMLEDLTDLLDKEDSP